jgi:Ca2+-binding EF-hand superfamily protein
MVWGFGSKKKKKVQEKKGLAKKENARASNQKNTNGDNNIDNDAQSEVVRKVKVAEFPKIFKKAEIEIYKKRFIELCGSNRNYITIGEFIFQLEFNGVCLIKRLVEVVLSLTGKAHAYNYKLAQLEIEKVNYKKKVHNINGMIFKKVEASTTQHGIDKPMFLVDTISSNGILGVHMTTPDSNPVAGDSLYSWASKTKPEKVFFADDFVNKKLDYVLNHISKLKVPIILTCHHIFPLANNNKMVTLPPPLHAMTEQEKSDLEDLGAFDATNVAINNDAKAKSNISSKETTKKDKLNTVDEKGTIPWGEKEYLYSVDVKKGSLGIGISKIKGKEKGAVVGALQSGSQAIALGIQKNDYLVNLLEFEQTEIGGQLGDGVDLINYPKDQVKSLLSKTTFPYKLTLLRLDHDTMYSVEFDKAKGGLGLKFADPVDDNDFITVQAIQKGSQAAASGAIAVGDHLAFVGAEDVIDHGLEEAIELIKKDLQAHSSVHLVFHRGGGGDKHGDKREEDTDSVEINLDSNSFLKSSKTFNNATKRDSIEFDDYINILQVLDKRFDSGLKETIIFEMYDVDGDGRIGQDDLVYVLNCMYRQSCPGRYSAQEIKYLAEEMLKTLNCVDGYLNRNTFMSYFGSCLSQLLSMPPHKFSK